LKNKEKKTLLIIGTGTIGYEVIERAVLLANIPFISAMMSPFFDWGEIIFHKKTPLEENEGRIEHLLMVGDGVKAKLCVDPDRVEDFIRIMGITPSYTLDKALNKADVIIDATPFASKNKKLFYDFFSDSRKIFIAQGSEFRKGNEFGDIFIGGIKAATVRRI